MKAKMQIRGIKKKTAFPEFLKAMTKYLKTPTPKYLNDVSYLFKFTTSSQFNFDQQGTGLYIQELFPQMYNLTNGLNKGTADNPIRVDTTSASAFLN